MKKLFALAALALACVLPVAAQKVATVDMEKVYRSHWKTEDFINKLQGARADLETKAQSMNQEREALIQEFNQLRERINNPAFDRATAEKEAGASLQKVQAKEQEINELVQRTRAATADRQREHAITIMNEIRLAVIEVAKRRNATLAFDSSGRSSNASVTFLWAADQTDITDEVVREVNKDRPAVITPPPPPPSRPQTPAAGEAPALQFGTQP